MEGNINNFMKNSKIQRFQSLFPLKLAVPLTEYPFFASLGIGILRYLGQNKSKNKAKELYETLVKFLKIRENQKDEENFDYFASITFDFEEIAKFTNFQNHYQNIATSVGYSI